MWSIALLAFVIQVVTFHTCAGVEVDRYPGVKPRLMRLEHFPKSTNTLEECAAHCKDVNAPFQCISVHYDAKTSLCETFHGDIFSKLPPMSGGDDLGNKDPATGALTHIAKSEGELMPVKVLAAASSVDECITECCGMHAPAQCDSISYKQMSLGYNCTLYHGVTIGLREPNNMEHESDPQPTPTPPVEDSGYIVLKDRNHGGSLGTNKVTPVVAPDTVPYTRYPNLVGYVYFQPTTTAAATFAECQQNCAQNTSCRSFCFDSTNTPTQCYLYDNAVIGMKAKMGMTYAVYDRIAATVSLVQPVEYQSLYLQSIEYHNNANESDCARRCYERVAPDECLMFKTSSYGFCTLFAGKYLDFSAVQPGGDTYGIIQDREWAYQPNDGNDVTRTCANPNIVADVVETDNDISMLFNQGEEAERQFIPPASIDICLAKLASGDSIQTDAGDCVMPVLFQAELQYADEVCGKDGHVATHLNENQLEMLAGIAEKTLGQGALLTGLTKKCMTNSDCQSRTNYEWMMPKDGRTNHARLDHLPDQFQAFELPYDQAQALAEGKANVSYLAVHFPKDKYSNEYVYKLHSNNEYSNVICQYEARERLMEPFAKDEKIITEPAYQETVGLSPNDCAVSCHVDPMCRGFSIGSAGVCKLYGVNIKHLLSVDFGPEFGTIIYAKTVLK